MRDAQNGVGRRSVQVGVMAALLGVAMVLAGCAAAPGKEKLAGAYKELENPRPNSAEIIAAADEYLQANPNGPAAADALYLHGRALEARAGQDVSSAARDSADAYNYYSQALSQKPRPGLEGLIHIGMGNILYFQERYAAGLTEFTAGYEKLERDDDKAWAMYRMGLCEQRLGKWSEADKDFAAVQQKFPTTLQAQRAREHQGATNFWIQVGTYASAVSADNVTNELKKEGLPAQRFQDNGRHVQYVRVGPFNSYETAAGTRQRLLPKYRDAMILP